MSAVLSIVPWSEIEAQEAYRAHDARRFRRSIRETFTNIVLLAAGLSVGLFALIFASKLVQGKGLASAAIQGAYLGGGALGASIVLAGFGVGAVAFFELRLRRVGRAYQLEQLQDDPSSWPAWSLVHGPRVPTAQAWVSARLTPSALEAADALASGSEGTLEELVEVASEFAAD